MRQVSAHFGGLSSDRRGQGLTQLITGIIVGAVLIMAGIWVVAEFTDHMPELTENSAADNAFEETEETVWDVFSMLPMILLIMVIVAVVGIIVTRLT